jgi:3-hydroxyisobutyrate dehydrogenase-like beta-hydroxyacid dehydrogenase
VGAALVQRNFSTDFALKHLLKDVNLIDRFAQDLNSPIPAGVAIRETIKSAVNQGWGEPSDVASAVLLVCTQSPQSRIIEIQMRTMAESLA